VSGDETPPCNPTEIAAALCASQRREERLCVTGHLNQYKSLTNRTGCVMVLMSQVIKLGPGR
jgi:hypothetical protein